MAYVVFSVWRTKTPGAARYWIDAPEGPAFAVEGSCFGTAANVKADQETHNNRRKDFDFMAGFLRAVGSLGSTRTIS
jgi:hypothetical protein